jgi:hypothetical protein
MMVKIKYVIIIPAAEGSDNSYDPIPIWVTDMLSRKKMKEFKICDLLRKQIFIIRLNS